MDLLLFLVKRHEIDLHDIPMAELVEQYLAHLRVIETIDVEQAGEFLVMAATLVEIKSRMIMPPALRGDEEGDGDGVVDTSDATVDPRFELVQQLLAYKRFKDAAHALEARAEHWEARFPASAKPGEPEASAEAEGDAGDARAADLDLDDVNVLDLCAAFGRAMEGIGHLGNHAVTYDDTPISLHADDIADRLARDGGERRALTLRALFEGRSRGAMIGLFLATLELVRQRKVRVVRGEAAGDPDGLELELRPEDDWLDPDRVEPDAPPAWHTADTRDDGAAVHYDWPDEAARQRAERRQRRRAAYGARDTSSAHADEHDVHDDPDDDTFDPNSVVSRSQSPGDSADTSPGFASLASSDSRSITKGREIGTRPPERPTAAGPDDPEDRP